MFKKSRKRKLEGEEESTVDWEQENIFPENMINEMETMWEIPQIFHFLHLAKEALNIPHLSMYEMERMLLIPRVSKQLANIMTSLLSSPMTKAKLRKIPPMPYEFWTNILAYKMKTWFKIYEAKHQDAVKVLETIGVEPEFWNIFPDAPLLNGKDFEDLTFRQKVWLLKTVCDTAMHGRKTIQEEIAKQPWEDQSETLLGTDRYGARYIFFPQFLKNDLRIYRHCLDNKILSTIKPIKRKVDVVSPTKVLVQNDSFKKRIKHRRRKSRWRYGLSSKSKRRAKKTDEKSLNDCKCSSDSATGSLINEDTSSTSTCSIKNNISNNNNIRLDTTNLKRSRSSSKCSEISVESDKTNCKNIRSSGYDTNSSIDSVCGEKSSQRMFRGFSGSSSNKYNIEVIGGIMNDLKSDTNGEKSSNGISLARTSQTKSELHETKQQYLDPVNLHRDEPVDRTMNNLSSISKTDDEKLNEIISAENMKLNDKSSGNVSASKESQHMSVVSKSDDEKLNETRSGQNQNENGSCSKEDGKSSFTRRIRKFAADQVSNEKFMRSHGTSECRKDIKSIDCKDLSLSELRNLLQKEAMEDDFSFDEDSEAKYNYKKRGGEKSIEWKQEKEDFKEMLVELSISKFQLIVDSLSSLRELISSFSRKDNSATTDADNEVEPMPPCEVKLVNKMRELLSSLEEIEPALRDSMKKARGKLQKEWTNFNEGVEDQDSSGEGCDSNWWVLGSQASPLSTSGDAALQTLSQFAISSIGSQNINGNKEADNAHGESSNKNGEECRESKEKSGQEETQGGQDARDKSNGQGNAEAAEETKEDSNEEEQQTKRVLRARGISSYTEQFYSDDEIEENELEEWTDVEAVYAAPSPQAGPSTANVSPKINHPNDRTEEEDSDQDWILPSSRKRKNKRPSAIRRLKSFQHKLQNIKMGDLQGAAESKMISPPNTKAAMENPAIKDVQICTSNKPVDSEASNNKLIIEKHEAVVENNLINEIVPSAITTCKIENITSVHSELDIKDEGPIYDSAPCNFNNSYSTTFNPNYVMLNPNPMNYYVMQAHPNTVDSQNTLMQPGPVVSNIIPPIHQSYYMQGGQNYVFENAQSTFVPSHPFQPQGPQMITPQHIINHPAYMPYMMTQSHPGYVPPEQVVSREIPQNSIISFNPSSAPMDRSVSNRFPMPRQGYLHPRGAVIRSSMPIRGNTPRASYHKVIRNVQQQQNTPVRMQQPGKLSSTSYENSGQRTTSLIVLSDSDDEIEMIITEKAGSEAEAEKVQSTLKKSNIQPTTKPTVVSSVTVSPKRNVIPPQIIQRMNQGGISITPVKSAPPVQNTGTQLVVVVNETGSHYALALPNGSKLILTPEQVAQIRASNGGKLVL